MLRAIPLLSLVVVLYFVTALTGAASVDGVAVAFALPSGAPFALKVGDALVGLGLLVLYLEILKSVRSSIASVIDHGLSLLLFALCLVLFFVLPMAGTATFFLILLLTAVDVIAGFTVTLAASRRSVDIGGGGL